MKRKKFFLGQTWYSLCSAHKEVQTACQLCRKGQWKYDATSSLSREFYRRHPKAWKFLANLPVLKAASLRLEDLDV